MTRVLLVSVIAISLVRSPSPAPLLQNAECESVEPALDLELSTNDSSKTTTLRKQTGRPLAVVVFTTWTKASDRGLKAMEEVFQRVRGRAQVIGLILDNSASEGMVVAAHAGANFGIYSAERNPELSKLLNIDAVPTVLVFEPRGRLCFRHRGVPESDVVVRQIDDMLVR